MRLAALIPAYWVPFAHPEIVGTSNPVISDTMLKFFPCSVMRSISRFGNSDISSGVGGAGFRSLRAVGLRLNAAI